MGNHGSIGSFYDKRMFSIVRFLQDARDLVLIEALLLGLVGYTGLFWIFLGGAAVLSLLLYGYLIYKDDH